MMIEVPSGKFLKFFYTNWRGEKSHRKAQIDTIYFGSTEYHKEGQWLMEAFDMDKNALRVFAMKDMEDVEFVNII